MLPTVNSVSPFRKEPSAQAASCHWHIQLADLVQRADCCANSVHNHVTVDTISPLPHFAGSTFLPADSRPSQVEPTLALTETGVSSSQSTGPSHLSWSNLSLKISCTCTCCWSGNGIFSAARTIAPRAHRRQRNSRQKFRRQTFPCTQFFAELSPVPELKSIMCPIRKLTKLRGRAWRGMWSGMFSGRIRRCRS